MTGVGSLFVLLLQLSHTLSRDCAKVQDGYGDLLAKDGRMHLGRRRGLRGKTEGKGYSEGRVRPKRGGKGEEYFNQDGVFFSGYQPLKLLLHNTW